MEKNKMINYLNSVYKKKSINQKEFNQVFSLLLKFEESDPFFFNFNMGKLIATFGRSEEAIVYLKKALKYGSSESSIYYNLFKCYVDLGNYDEAVSSLRLCEEKYSKYCNFSFPMQMLFSLIMMNDNFNNYFESDYNVESSLYLYFNNLSDNRSIMNFYTRAVEAFNTKNFDLMMNILRSMDAKIRDTNYPIDLRPILVLGSELKKMYRVKSIQLIRDYNNNEICTEKYLNLAKDMLEKGTIDIKKIFVAADRLIAIDVAKAEGLVNVVEQSRYSNCVFEIDYLKNKIKEKKDYESLKDDVKVNYDFLHNEGDMAYKKGEFSLAYQKYLESLEISNLPIANYYIGKALFKEGNYDESFQYLLKYLAVGGDKLDKCLLYLGVISSRLGSSVDNRKYILLMEKLNESFDKKFNYKGPGSTYALKLNQNNDSDDNIKNRAYKRVKISEDEISREESSFSPENFYEYDLTGKLEVIKGFLRSGQEDVANSLLKELGPLSKTERSKVNQFQKNKKIYSNQNRTN